MTVGCSTVNRLELGILGQAQKDRYKRIVACTGRLEALLGELCLEWPAEAPQEIVLDVDGTDNPLHDLWEERLFHGYCECYF